MENSFARFRLKKDVENLLLKDLNFKLNNLTFSFEITVNNEIYNNTYKFECICSENYPFQSPKLYCLTRTYHPNIYEIKKEEKYKGSVCLNILRLGWSPSYDLNSIVVSTIDTFTDVSYEDPFDIDAANLLKNDKKAFIAKVKQEENKK
ncbi:ube2m [Ecytonucleospora hepatopenaei]|uniref:Ube2m n=1 Tax=Ecytonucleospora hepatopenaei TaxID=646526 RepID=A0A1W0E964_9MICR|nr:ube2m [Ecytonucleospora hepatopenaei]